MIKFKCGFELDQFKMKSAIAILAALFAVSLAVFSDSTVYDGVTYNTNNYLYFGGESGVRLEKSLFLTEYTYMVWFRME